MPYPTVKALPQPPSRVSRPETFVNESALYLAALPQFSTEYNALVTYVNSKIPNFHNYGSVMGANPANPSISVLLDSVGGDTVAYTSSLDSLYSSVKNLSSTLPTNLGSWIDAVMFLQGSIPSDANKPNLTNLTAPQSRTQDRATFNTAANDFKVSIRNNITSIATLVAYVNQSCFSNVDYGLITDGSISETLDYGLVTDSTLTY